MRPVPGLEAANLLEDRQRRAVGPGRMPPGLPPQGAPPFQRSGDLAQAGVAVPPALEGLDDQADRDPPLGGREPGGWGAGSGVMSVHGASSREALTYQYASREHLVHSSSNLRVCPEAAPAGSSCPADVLVLKQQRAASYLIGEESRLDRLLFAE